MSEEHNKHESFARVQYSYDNSTTHLATHLHLLCTVYCVHKKKY